MSTRLFLEVIKKAVKFFAIGAVLALCAPTIGSLIGLAPTAVAARGELGKMGDPLLVGLTFAGIVTLDALLKPVFNKIFKTNKPSV